MKTAENIGEQLSIFTRQWIFMRKTENIYEKNWEYLWEKLRIYMRKTENIYENYWEYWEYL